MLVPVDIPFDVRFTLDIRDRYERRLERDFLESNADDRSDFFMRIRPGIELTLEGGWSAAVQYQFAHNSVWSPGVNGSFENSDAREAFVRRQGRDGTLTIGRQKAFVGSERLIGAGEWTNVGRSFDGVRFQNKSWDVLAATIGVSAPRPRNARLAAAVYSWRAGQSMVAFKYDEIAAGEQRIATLNHSKKWSRGPWEYDVDGAVQFGRNAGLDHEAWALHAGAAFKPDSKNRLYFEANAASGGPGTSKSETFDNLYPTNHRFYGSMDLQAWKNMREFVVGWQHKLGPAIDFHVHGHLFGLMDARDAWYGAAGTPNKRVGGVFRDPSGASGKDVGAELDVEFAMRLDKRSTLQFGIGIFEPGKFVERMNGGEADRQTWCYVQIQRRM